MKEKVRHLNGDVLTVFCNDCKCCLGSDHHCAKCHMKKSVETLCGCGTCLERLEEYLERVAAKQRRQKLLEDLGVK